MAGIYPQPPSWVTPRFQGTGTLPQYTSPITLAWTDRLASYAEGSTYYIEIASDYYFTTGLQARSAPKSQPYLIISLAPGTYYCRVRAGAAWPDSLGRITCHYLADPEGSLNYIWSTVRSFEINNNPDPIHLDDGNTDVIDENLQKPLPIIYGKFTRNETSPTKGDGLAIAYLGRILESSIFYYLCEHDVMAPYELYIPAPGNNEVMLKPNKAATSFTYHAANAYSIGSTSIEWKPENTDGFRLWRTYELSPASLINPFSNGVWDHNVLHILYRDDATYKNVCDTLANGNGNPLTQAVCKTLAASVKSKGFDLGGIYALSGARLWDVVTAGAAWEIHDPEQSLTTIFESTENPELRVNYANITSLQSAAKAAVTVYTAYICNFVDPSSFYSRVGCQQLLGPVNDNIYPGCRTLTPNNTNYLSTLSAISEFDNSTNRKFGFFIGAKLIYPSANSSVAYPVGEPFFKIGGAQVTFNQRVTGNEILKVPTAYAACRGKAYGTWLASFKGLSYSSQECLLKNIAAGSTIEEPSMIIASILIDYCGLPVSMFDMPAFRAAATTHKMRVNVIEEDATARSVIEEICQCMPYTFCLTASGRATLCLERTYLVYFGDFDATILYDDIEASSLSITKTSTDSIVNTLVIKSRYLQETDTWVDEDTFVNETSVVAYGTKKSKRPLEFKYVNCGPGTDSTSSRDAYNNATSPLNINAVKWAAIHYIEPDTCNGRTDTKHKYNDGAWAVQRNEITFRLPGYKYMNLEVGDMIRIDNTSFMANSVPCFGDDWTTKRFRILDITKDETGVTINKAKELPTYDNFFELRGLQAVVGV